MSNLIRQNPGYVAAAAMAAFAVIKPGAVDGACLPATAATDLLLGVSDGLAKDVGEMVDAPSAGVGEVRLGAAVTRGQKLTADASSKAVPCAPGAGVNHHYFGVALQSGVADDVVLYQVGLGVMQG
jgi:hypothetical protein